MKLVKFVPAVAATLVLAACSAGSNVVSNTADAVGNAANAVTGAVTATSNAVTGIATTVKETAAGELTKTEALLPTQNKSVVYDCQNNTTVTATYAFHNEDVKGANLKVGKTAIKGFVTNAELSQKLDAVTFVSGQYSFSVENGLTYSNAEKATAIMLTKHGKKADQILAKNCKINESATARLNK